MAAVIQTNPGKRVRGIEEDFRILFLDYQRVPLADAAQVSTSTHSRVGA